jgi:hypothetical protein
VKVVVIGLEREYSKDVKEIVKIFTIAYFVLLGPIACNGRNLSIGRDDLINFSPLYIFKEAGISCFSFFAAIKCCLLC